MNDKIFGGIKIFYLIINVRHLLGLLYGLVSEPS